MTARQLVKLLNDLGEDNLDREIVMADCNYLYTPYKVEILDKEWKTQCGKILID